MLNAIDCCYKTSLYNSKYPVAPHIVRSNFSTEPFPALGCRRNFLRLRYPNNCLSCSYCLDTCICPVSVYIHHSHMALLGQSEQLILWGAFAAKSPFLMRHRPTPPSSENSCSTPPLFANTNQLQQLNTASLLHATVSIATNSLSYS